MIGRIVDKNGNDLGSGFTIGARVAITAAHVVGKRTPGSIRFKPTVGKQVSVKQIECAADEDIAVLHLGAAVPNPLTVVEAAENEEWRVDSRPKGNDPRLTGRVTDARRALKNATDNEVVVLQLDVKQELGSYAGYSGSAVLRRFEPGSVMGVVIEQLPLRLRGSTSAANVLYAARLDGIIQRFNLGVAIAPSGITTVQAPEQEATVVADPATAALRSFDGLLYSSTDLQRWYLKSVPDIQRAPEVRDLASAIAALSQMAPGIGGVPTLGEFVERAYRKLQAPALEQWLRSTLHPTQLADLRQRLDLEDTALKRRSEEFLLVEVHSRDDPRSADPVDPVELEFWLHTSSGWVDHGIIKCTEAAESENGRTPDDRIRAAFNSILERALSIVSRETVIEFLLPRKLFCLRPQRWEFGTDYEPPQPIGIHHPVVLRWRERLRAASNVRAGAWTARANEIKQRISGGQAPVILCVNQDDYSPGGLRTALENEQARADIIGLLFVPPEVPPSVTNDIIVSALLSGIPYAFWLESDAVDATNARQVLNNIALVAGIDGLPRRIRQLRAQAGANPNELGGVLSMIWDDPSHSPKPLPLAAP